MFVFTKMLLCVFYFLFYLSIKRKQPIIKIRTGDFAYIMVETIRFSIVTKGSIDIINITDIIQNKLKEAQMNNGIVTVFVPGSTAGITTIEYEPGLRQDVKDFYEKLIPYGIAYKHHDTWNDDNGSSHIQSMLQKPSMTIPFSNKSMLTGTWQQVVFIDFDTRPRNRTIILQLIGE